MRSRTTRALPESRSCSTRTRCGRETSPRSRVTIDRAGRRRSCSCANASPRDINATLGRATKSDYTLEVESAGLDRPLLRPGDYERFAGSAVRDRDLAARSTAARRIAACCAACAARTSCLETERANCRCRSRRSNRRTWSTTRAPILQRDKLERKQRHGNENGN